MRNKIFLSFLLSICFLFVKAQTLVPVHPPFPYSPTQYYHIGWMQTDSGYIAALRDTTLRPKYAGTIIVWQHASVDTSAWMWTGIRFVRFLRMGDVTGGGGGPIQLQGDVTTPLGTGLLTATLATVNSNVGTFGSGSAVGSFTVNGKGLITAASAISIQIAESQVTNLTSDLASKIGLSSLSALPPMSYNNVTGQFSIQQANTSQNGYLTSTDWNTFNGKLNTSLNSGFIFVGNGSNVATGVAMSGDATISNTGVFTLTSVISGGTCTNCNLTFDSKGRITVAASGSGGGGSGTVTNVGAGGLSGFFTSSTSNATTTPFTSFTLVNAGANTVWGNNTGSTAAPGYFVPNLTLLNTWASGTIAMDGANVNFANLTATGTVTFSGLLSGGATDSIVTWNPVTHLLGVTNRLFQLFAVEGVSQIGNSGDSLQFGGSRSPLFQPDTLFVNFQHLYFANQLGKGSLAATDSVEISTISGELLKVPTSLFGTTYTFVNGLTNTSGTVSWGGTLTGATTITDNAPNQLTWTGTFTTTANNQFYEQSTPTITLRATASDAFTSRSYTPTVNIGANNQTVNVLSLIPTVNVGAFTGTVSNALLLGGNIGVTTDNAFTFGDGAHAMKQIYTHQTISPTGYSIGMGASQVFNLALGGVNELVMSSAKQMQLNGYTSTSAYTGGTTIGLLGFDASGNVYPIIVSTNLTLSGQTLTAAGGGGGGSLTRQGINSGTTATVGGGNYNVVFFFSAPILSFNLTLPASPTDQQIVQIHAGGTLSNGSTMITNFTVSPNSGQTITEDPGITPTTYKVGWFEEYQWDATLSTWFHDHP